MESIQHEIETQRMHLAHLADKYGLDDRRVLIQSQELDKLIYEFQRRIAV